MNANKIIPYDESTNPGNGWRAPEGNAFADMGDDLDALNAPSRNPLKQPKADRPMFKVACLKCRGTGRYMAPSSHGSRCFACQGIGFRETKTDPDKLAANRVKAAARKAQAKSDAIGAWRAANAAEAQWIDANEGRFDFATAMANALVQWGSLTPGQLGAVQRCIEGAKAREIARAAANVVQEARTEAVSAAKLEEAFAKAKASGLKWPKITLTHFTFKPAGANSKNAGAIYVTRSRKDDGDGTYLGKVMAGRFTPSRECDEERQREMVGVLADPAAAAKAYGLLTGNCCICSRELTNKESIDRGIGPICAEKFGW